MLETHTIRLGDARDRLDARLDELAAQVEDPDAPPRDVLEEAQAIESQRLPGVMWGIAEYGADAEVTIGELSHGEMAEVTDRVSGAQAEQIGGADGVSGAATTFFVAAGLADAPFLDESYPTIEAAAPVVGGDLHPQFVAFLESEIDDVTSVDAGNVTPFAERVTAEGAATSEPE
jgi:hypothetical protein